MQEYTRTHNKNSDHGNERRSTAATIIILLCGSNIRLKYSSIYAYIRYTPHYIMLLRTSIERIERDEYSVQQNTHVYFPVPSRQPSVLICSLRELAEYSYTFCVILGTFPLRHQKSDPQFSPKHRRAAWSYSTSCTFYCFSFKFLHGTKKFKIGNLVNSCPMRAARHHTQLNTVLNTESLYLGRIIFFIFIFPIRNTTI